MAERMQPGVVLVFIGQEMQGFAEVVAAEIVQPRGAPGGSEDSVNRNLTLESEPLDNAADGVEGADAKGAVRAVKRVVGGVCHVFLSDRVGPGFFVRSEKPVPLIDG
jgi:hypothetical protein